MSILLLILLAIVLGAVIWLALQPSAYKVERSRVMNVTADQVYREVADFKHWIGWSPWLMHEKGASIVNGDITDQVGGWYSWDGKHVGAGKMTHASLTENEAIEQNLEFTSPMKSESTVYWRFNPAGEGETEVTWGMHGTLPFHMRWMARMMDQWVGKDYELGLDKLAMQSGDTRTAYDIEFLEDVETQSENYIGLHYAGDFDGMKAAMQEAFPKLTELVQKESLDVTGPAFTLYHNFDVKKQKVICDMVLPVKEPREIDGFVSGTLLGDSYTRTRLTGDYRHLEMAWYAAFANARMYKKKIRMSKPMIERYLNSPQDTAADDLQTYIDLPLK